MEIKCGAQKEGHLPLHKWQLHLFWLCQRRTEFTWGFGKCVRVAEHFIVGSSLITGQNMCRLQSVIKSRCRTPGWWKWSLQMMPGPALSTFLRAKLNQTKSSNADQGLPSWRPCSVLPVLSDRRLWLAVLLPPLLLIVLLIVNSKSLLCGRRSGSYGYWLIFRLCFLVICVRTWENNCAG